MAPPSHASQQMQVKTASVKAATASLNLDIHNGKARSSSATWITPIKPITLHEVTQKVMEEFSYLGRIID
ncbi:unnamed protein product [Schistosoma curassoni]|uniref:Ovule protein n=1 Tax=Schistosoma curassoni TaxID=6186 RepID=A0A183JK58_9TREM|nr:unnamed protein product [Schistosoma curassoni]